MTTRWVVALAVVAVCLTATHVHALYTSSDDVVELTEANFKSEVLKSDAIWIVEFYAPWCGHCKNLVPEYKKAATALKGIVKIGAVDMTAHQSVGGPYDVKGFPTIKVFGANKSSPTDFQGARTADGLVDAGLAEVKSVAKARLSGKASGSKKDSSSKPKSSGSSGSSGGSTGGGKGKVVELSADNFEETVLQSDDVWLVEFFAPWCGHCKSLAPQWEKAADMIAGHAVHLATVDATVHGSLAQSYGVQGYPTIKVFKAGPKNAKDATSYDGARTADAIAKFALSLAEDKSEPKPVAELTSDAVMTEQCGSTSMCLIAYLPHILDSKKSGRDAYLSVLKAVSLKQKGKAISFVWVEAGQQETLSNALDLGGAGYPAVAVFNAKKGRYARHLGTFTADGINDFLRDVLSGKVKTIKQGGGDAPPKIDTTTPWDGKDGVLPTESSSESSSEHEEL